MITQLIKTRRSVFPAQYNDTEVTKAELKTILESANWAPTHRKTEPWRFKVLQAASQESLGLFLAKKFEETTEKPSQFKLNKLKENPKKAGAIIAICMQRDLSESVPEWEEVAATAMAVQNMWLTAHSLQIGAYWSSPGLIKYMDEFFELKEGESCLGFLYLGKYDEPLPEGVRNTTIEDKTEWLF